MDLTKLDNKFTFFKIILPSRMVIFIRRKHLSYVKIKAFIIKNLHLYPNYAIFVSS